MMKKQRPLRAILLLCAAIGLASCQSSSGSPFAGLFGAPPAPPPSCGAANADEGRVVKLQKENARLRRQLAQAMEDNATLRDLAAKKW